MTVFYLYYQKVTIGNTASTITDDVTALMTTFYLYYQKVTIGM